MKMDFATFDIETIPNMSLSKDLIPQFDPDTVKLGNVKDQTKIDDKIEKARQEFDEGLSKKMSLDPDLCEIVCFAYDYAGSKAANISLIEKQVIAGAWNVIKTSFLNHIPLVSFNGIQFDLPVLWHNAMRLNIPVSPEMYVALTKRYENRHHYDLMQILAGWDRTKWKPLDFYLKLFSIGEKSGDGSQVYEMWKAKEYDKVREYCQKDVELTGKLFERLKGWIVKEIDESLPF